MTEKINKKKEETVKELSNLIKNKKTILIASIKNIPASQFQEISKKLRGKAIIKIPKKSLILRALNFFKSDEIEKLKSKVQESTAILFSDLDSFDLALELINSKKPAKAKTGQEAPEDIEIQPGPTDLVPGPAISELGALGIKIQIEGGKITIKEAKRIVREGEKISEGVADIMNKLDIKPFSIGFIPVSACDTKEKKFYANININREEILKEIKSEYSKALAFAIEIEYISEDTVKFLIRKAMMHNKALEKINQNKNN